MSTTIQPDLRRNAGKSPHVPTTGPTVEPVTRQEAKDHANILITEDDGQIDRLIPLARQCVEDMSGRSLINQTWKEYYDGFPSEGDLRLTHSPLSSVTSVTYVDVDGATQTVDSSVYTDDAIAEPARVVLAYNQSWPTARSTANAIIATYVAGYGAAASDVPPRFVQAILMLVAHWYMLREPYVPGTKIFQVPMAVDSLVMIDRAWWF